MRRVLIVACVAAISLFAANAFASTGTQADAVVALHAGTHLMKGDTPCDWGGLACSDFVTEWPLMSSANLYLVVARGLANPGIAGLSCGVLYNGGAIGGATKGDGFGVDLYSWTLCTSGLEFPNSDSGLPADEWPASGGGNRITWNALTDCQVAEIGGDGVHAIAGSFYVYAYNDDLFQIDMNRNLQSPDEFQVGDCNNSITDLPWPSHAGAVGFGAMEGSNPCGPIPVQPATWGQIKSQY